MDLPPSFLARYFSRSSGVAFFFLLDCLLDEDFLSLLEDDFFGPAVNKISIY